MVHKPSPRPHWSALGPCWLDQSPWCGCPSQSSSPRWRWAGTDLPWWDCWSWLGRSRREETFPDQTPRCSSEPLYYHSDTPSGVPVDSCCRRPPTLSTHTHTNIHTNTQTHTRRDTQPCNSCRQTRHALRGRPGLCHISHTVVGLTGKGLHRCTNSTSCSAFSPGCL